MQWFGRAASSVGMALLFFAVASGQKPVAASNTRSQILVRVTDPSGAFIPQAEVSFRSPLDGFAKATTAYTNEKGEAIVTVPLGEYLVRVTSPGFRVFSLSGFVVRSTQEPPLDVSLKVGSIGTPVLIYPSPAPEQPDLAQLPEQQIFEIPITAPAKRFRTHH